MILLILLQLFQSQIDSTRNLVDHLQFHQAYKLSTQIDTESLSELKRCEVLELQGLILINLRKYERAEYHYERVFDCTDKRILSRAYTNYADLKYKQFDFDARLKYLQLAYQVLPSNQDIRILSKHYLEVEGNLEKAKLWLSKHETLGLDSKDRAGLFILKAKIAEFERKYELSTSYYSKAKIDAHRANLFSYELFAAEGEYRSQKLLEAKEQENVINTLSWLILSVVIYYLYKMKKYVPSTFSEGSGRD